MTNSPITARTTTLRPAVDADIRAIAELWHRGWRDGHLGHVPAALVQHRVFGDFLARVPTRLDTTTVATTGLGIAGFVVTHEDEVEQIYVDAAARGTGIATALLQHGETVIQARFDKAWLAVVAGNARARRFYERNGWSDTGAVDYPARTADDSIISVPAHRYEKQLSPLGRVSAAPSGDRLPRARPCYGASDAASA